MPPRDRRFGSGVTGCAALIVALSSTGCDESRAPSGAASPAAPSVSELDLELAGTQSTFYPLELGNAWHFDRRVVVDFYEPGSTVPYDTWESHSEEDRVLDQTEELSGRTYVVESGTIVQDFPQPGVIHEWIRYRQDGSGLYVADAGTHDPPGPEAEPAATGAATAAMALPSDADWNAFGAAAIEHPESFRSALAAIESRRLRLRRALRGERVGAPPGGVLPDELTRLKYPLHPGARFAILEDFLEAHVEAREQLVTPAGTFPAWRIRLAWATPGFEDTILLWFGRCGTLKFYFQGESAITAPDGTVLGTMQIEEVEVVEELDVQGRPCGQWHTRPALD